MSSLQSMITSFMPEGEGGSAFSALCGPEKGAGGNAFGTLLSGPSDGEGSAFGLLAGPEEGGNSSPNIALFLSGRDR